MSGKDENGGGDGATYTSERRLRTIIEQSPLAMHVFAPDGTSLLANSAWDGLWDLGQKESSEGGNIFADEQVKAAGLLPYVVEAAAGQSVATAPLLYDPARTGRTGAPMWLKAFVYPVKDAEGRVGEVTLVIEDVTERKGLEERLAHHALHDDLTNLANRTLAVDRLGHALGRRDGAGVAVLFVDLDNFKHINDSLGLAAGDGLLVEVAARLRACAGSLDTVARLGGDEFVVVLENGDARAATRMADDIVARLGGPYRLQGRELFATASVGIALGGPDRVGPDEPENLLRGSGIAMYEAKEMGKNRHVVFDASMDGRSSRRIALESGLRRAVEAGEFVLRYQPLVEVDGGETVGLEALVRWDRPGQGLVPPSDFVPLAEETDLIVSIGRLVLIEACTRAREWRDAGGRGPTVWVNLSARQLREPGLLDSVSDALGASGLDPEGLGLEITESVAMDTSGLGAERTAATLRALRGLGVRLAIDDFGTGYSSLSYLKRLPVDFLKIDRSFVAGLARETDDAAIVSAVIDLARAMGLRVTAEGVETDEQLQVLTDLGCHQAQGYLISRPLPWEGVRDFLGRRRPVAG